MAHPFRGNPFRRLAPLLGLLFALCLLLWVRDALPLGVPLYALAFAPRPPRPEQESLWGEEPEGDGGGEDPFDVALGRRDAEPLPNPLAGRFRGRGADTESTTAERPSFERRGNRPDARSERRRSAGAFGARLDGERRGGAPSPEDLGRRAAPAFAGLRLRTGRIALLLILAGIAASFLPLGDPPHGLAAILRPILRDPFNASGSPAGIADAFFALALLLVLADSLRSTLAVLGGTQAAAAIRRAARRGAEANSFDDGDGKPGLFEGISLRELLTARRKRGDR